MIGGACTPGGSCNAITASIAILIAAFFCGTRYGSMEAVASYAAARRPANAAAICFMPSSIVMTGA